MDDSGADAVSLLLAGTRAPLRARMMMYEVAVATKMVQEAALKQTVTCQRAVPWRAWHPRSESAS